MNKYTQSDIAHKTAEGLLKAFGFEDLTPIRVMVYTDAEIVENDEGQRDWVGQYAAGSVDDQRGLTVLLAIDKHESERDMLDTILHECGHAVWELIDAKSKRKWEEAAHDDPHSPEESFADHMMHLLRGEPQFAPHEALFQELTTLND